MKNVRCQTVIVIHLCDKVNTGLTQTNTCIQITNFTSKRNQALKLLYIYVYTASVTVLVFSSSVFIKIGDSTNSSRYILASINVKHCFYTT